MTVTCQVDESTRRSNARLHSAGHLLDVAIFGLGFRWQPGKGYHFADGPYVEYIPSKDGRQLDMKDAKAKDVAMAEMADKMKELIAKKVATEVGFVNGMRTITMDGVSCGCGGTHVELSSEIGEVLSWKGRFGWIRPEKRINHEEAAKHGGRVYVHISDVEGRQELSENSRVSFLAYGDGDGLGAEQVRVEGQALGRDIIAGVATVVRTRATQRGYGVGPSAPPRPAGTAGAGAAAPGAPGAPGAPAAAGAAGAASAKGQGNSSSSTANGMAMAAEAAFKYIPPPGTVRWWKDLVGDCCPISLTQLEELSVDPFGLLGTSENDEALPSEGIWGKAGEMMVRNNQQQAVHWFDGMFLASFLVSSGQLIDPVNRRSLSRGECKSLDEYIQAHGFPAVHVTDAYDLARAVKTTSQASDGPAAARMAILEREAASMLRSLFDFRTVGSRGAQASGPPAPATGPGKEAPVLQQTHWPALGEQAAQDRKPSVQQPSSERRIRTCTQRTVHNDGGLQVVDDTEFDIEYEEEEEEQSPPDPTLADSAASVPRRTRLARLPRRDGAQITFSVTGRAREPIEGRGGGARTAATSTPQPRLEEATSDSEDEQESGALEVEDWRCDHHCAALANQRIRPECAPILSLADSTAVGFGDKYGVQVVDASSRLAVSLVAARGSMDDVVDCDLAVVICCGWNNVPKTGDKCTAMHRRSLVNLCSELQLLRHWEQDAVDMRHAGYFAREFDRTFVDDGQQYAEFCNFASTQSVNLFREYVRQFYQTLKKGAQLNKLEPGWVPYGWVYLLKEDKLVTNKALQVMQLTKPIPDTDGWKEDRTRADTAHQAAKGHRTQASAAQVVACRPLDGDLAVEMQVLSAWLAWTSDLQVQCLVGQGLVKPQAYDALTCVWCRKQEKLFRLQSLAAVFQHFESQSHVRSQDDGGVTHTHPAPQEQQPQVEQEQEPTDGEPVNDSSGLEWSSDKHLPTRDELIELSKEQQEAILGGSGDLSFNMSPWIRALVSIVYDFNEGLPQYCAEQVLVLSNCKTTPVTKNPVLLKFRGKCVEEEVLSSQSKLLGMCYSLLGAALGAWAVAAGHDDSKFWEASDVFLMIANCQAIKREQSLRKDAPFPDSKFRILRKMVDGKEVLAFRVVPTAARQFDNPTVSQYYNGNSVKLHRAVVQSQSSHNPQQQPAKRQRQGFPGLVWRSGWHYGWHRGDHSEWEAGWQDRQHSGWESGWQNR
ncbi:unnamed protein product [Effrenium voratum]|uniref:Uncharacterized protein n=1 Tax=Effrenium voratum TaxID=2562239 RepID=A0AA36IF40_9DINO|nr:unnamed protein product [Effrenium voratum]